MPPAGGNKPEIIASVGADFDGSAVAEGLKKMGTDWGKRMRQIEKKSQESMKGTGKSIKQFMWQMGGAKKAYKQLYETQVKSLRGARTEYTKTLREVRGAQEAVKDLERAMKGIDKIQAPDVYEKMNKDLAAANKELEKAQSKSAKAGSERAEAMGSVKEIKEATTFHPEEIVEGFKDAASEIYSPFESLMNKDLPGALEKGGKLVGKGWEKLFKGGGKLVKGIGKGFAKSGSALQKMGAAKGGVGGAAMGGVGKALGGIGKLVSSMGPILKMVSALGPIVMTLSSLIVGIVKLLIDAESGAKEFNKSILATAGSAEFLSRNMKNSHAAAMDLEDTLTDIRDAANSLDNMDWGINKETHTAVLNALTSEGVSLKKLDDDFKRTADSAKEATTYAKGWGSMVQMSVAYSRAFGVSLNDIGSLQGEMMSELGMNLDQTESSFQYMLHSADEAGIATNKFFGIIRGFSADMTLFNIRMEDVTKTMVMLGKAMSPREAQKMLSSLNSMFKGRDLLSRTKDVIMGGAGVRKAMNEQQTGNVKGLAEDVGISPKEMKQILKRDSKQLAKWLATDGKKLTADQRKAVFEASIMEHKLDTGDTIDLASAIKDANPWTAKKIADAKVAAITGGKKIDQLTGINRIAAESAAEVGDELQDSIVKLEMSTATMKADLGEKLKTAHGLASKFTKEEQKLLDKLGVKIDDGTTFDKVDAATSAQFYNSLDASQKELLTNGKKEIDYQKDIAGLQTSALDKLQVLIDFIMNQIYDAFQSIEDFISDMLDIMDITGKHTAEMLSSSKKREAEKGFVKSGNKDLIDAWNKSGGDLGAMRKELEKAGGLYDKSYKAVDKTAQNIKDLQKKLADPATPEDQKKGLQEQLDTQNRLLDEFRKTGVRGGDWKDIIKSLGLNNDQMAKMTAYAKGRGGNVAGEGGGDLMAALKQSGVTLDADTIAKIAKAGIGSQKQAGVMAGSAKDLTRTIGMTEEDPTKAKNELDALKVQRDTAKAAELSRIQQQKLADAATAKGSIYTHDMTAEEHNEEMKELAGDQADSLNDIYRALRFRGIRIDRTFLRNEIKEVIHDATFDAFSEALVDYYVLEHTDSEEALNAIKKGGDPKTFSRSLREDFAGGKGDLDKDKGMIKGLRPNATGGVISAVRNGMAVVRPAAGEGVLSGRPGERIGGGGDGGGGTVITLKGDAAKLFEVMVDNRIANAESKRQTR